MTLGLTLILLGVLGVASGFMNLSVMELMTGTRDPNKRRNTIFGGNDDELRDSDFGGGTFSSGGSDTLLYQLALTARNSFDLNVREMWPFDRVDPVHAVRSLHYDGKVYDPHGDDAFDASGTVSNMAAFADYVFDNFRSSIDELIWSGRNPRYIKDGKAVPPYAVATHKTHVHCGIKGSRVPADRPGSRIQRPPHVNRRPT